MTENARREYYAFHPQYYQLRELRKHILTDDCASAIKLIESERIPVDSYISGMRKDTWVPLVYLAAMSDKRESLVKYLVSHGAKIASRPDGDAPPIIFVCHSKYLKYFISHGGSQGLHNISITEQVRDALIHGEGVRVTALLKTGIIKDGDMEGIQWNQVIMAGLKLALSYLCYKYTHNKEDGNLQALTSDTIGRYRHVAELAVRYGWKQPAPEICRLCVEYYMFEILSVINCRMPLEVMYHTQMDRQLVAIYRPLLNDKRYEETCRILGMKPDPELYVTDIFN